MTEISSVEAAVDVLRKRGISTEIEVAFVLGTGLGSMADAVENPVCVPFAELPGFPATKVSGHQGQLVVGMQEGTSVAYMQGRSHYYETGDPATMFPPLETLAFMGAHTLILTNSAGSCKRELLPGGIAVITDHINFSGRNPLLGTGTDNSFVSLVNAYDPRLIKRLKQASTTVGTNLQEAVYMWFSGPTFETPAEVRMARLLGADLVGMSTVPEVILARRIGLRVAALSIVTNFATGFSGGDPSHTETKEKAVQTSIALKRLIRSFLRTKEEAWGIRQAQSGSAF